MIRAYQFFDNFREIMGYCDEIKNLLKNEDLHSPLNSEIHTLRLK